MVAITRFVILLVAVLGSFTFAQIPRDDASTIAEQERLDMIFRAFERLPVSELERFDIDIATPIFVDTLRAENLKTAWSKRQEELKIAMASVAKPAEFMAEIALKLRENNQSLNECIESLKELESLLSDIDNARDFYTIGGWSILLSMLDIDRNPLQQQYAAWAIGTAVKNSYDFQLWLLQSDVSHPSKLVLKTNNKKDRDYDKNINKSQNESKHNKHNKNDKNDKNDRELSLMPITKNQTLSISKNHNNSSLNSDNKNENRAQSMTGIEKLVSLLYHSTKNVTFILENKPNLDELQRKVLYAISAAARGNVDVQEILLKIDKSNFGIIDNDEEINLKEIKNDGLKIMDKIDNSVFMNYLILVAEKSSSKIDDNNSKNDNNNYTDKNVIENNLSLELTRKIWTFIGDLLEERAYIRGDLSLFSDLPEKAVIELSNLVLMGDLFLTEYWFNLAGKTFEKFFNSYTIEKEKNIFPNYELNVNGEIIDEKNESQNTESTVSTDLKKRSLRSILENILVVKKEIITQNKMIKLNMVEQYNNNSNNFLMTLKIMITSESYENEGLIEKSKSLVEALKQ